MNLLKRDSKIRMGLDIRVEKMDLRPKKSSKFGKDLGTRDI